MTGPYPKTPTFLTIDEPFRFEGGDLRPGGRGQVPAELNGTFYRVGPDQAFPPKMGDANPFNGDGIVSAFRFADGHVDFQHRYVMTHRLKAERAARRGLFGDYRNAFTDDASVAGVQRTVSNTNVVPHAGHLLAMKEDGPPYALDPRTLETQRLWDWKGQMTACSFTAHPKIDPATGELFGYSYAAKGEATDDIAVYGFDWMGMKTWEVWFKSPYPGMIHECAISEHYLVFAAHPAGDGSRAPGSAAASPFNGRRPTTRCTSSCHVAVRRRTCVSSERRTRCQDMLSMPSTMAESCTWTCRWPWTTCSGSSRTRTENSRHRGRSAPR